MSAIKLSEVDTYGLYECGERKCPSLPVQSVTATGHTTIMTRPQQAKTQHFSKPESHKVKDVDICLIHDSSKSFVLFGVAQAKLWFARSKGGAFSSNRNDHNK